MSDPQADKQMSVLDLILAVLAAIVGIPLLIILVAEFINGGLHLDAKSPSQTDAVTSARIAAVGLSKVDESGPPGSRTGRAVYESVCFSCHATGMAGSPKFGDASAGHRVSARVTIPWSIMRCMASMPCRHVVVLLT